jgi:hypothetical protein
VVLSMPAGSVRHVAGMMIMMRMSGSCRHELREHAVRQHAMKSTGLQVIDMHDAGGWHRVVTALA